jgi:hypothetical protein
MAASETPAATGHWRQETARRVRGRDTAERAAARVSPLRTVPPSDPRKASMPPNTAGRTA